MSDRGIIVHLDNEEERLKEFKDLYDQLGIDLDLIPCQTKEEFQKLIEDNYNNLRGLVFDLFGAGADKGELSIEDAEFLESINDSFEHISIPIFIYSGFLPSIEEEFNEHGTIFKIDKGDGPNEILRLIKLFHNSGFLDLFSPGGKIEKELHKDLNKAFTSQFTDNRQIENIISTVSEDSEEIDIKRVERIFKRIAVRSLMTGLKINDSETELYADDFNPVEHYVRRINDQPISTGDIFTNSDQSEYLLVLTPRCDLANKNPESILVCNINTNKFPDKTVSNKQKEKIKYALTDNPEYSGYDRYLARSPFFDGGLIKISTYRMIPTKELSSEYTLVVSLSEELTNEILGKFGSYFFRTGITDWNLEETISYLDSLKEEENS